MPKRWTFLVYLAGDNNLDAFGRQDLMEMQAVGSTTDIDIVAQFDGMEDGAARRYHITRSDSLDDDVVDELPEVNTGDPDALVDFVTWALAEYPADRTALVLWNHGTGWRDEDIYRLAGGGQPGDPNAPRSLVRGVGERGVRRSLFRTSIASVMEYPAEVRGILFDDTSRDFLDGRELAGVLTRIVAARSGRKLDLIGFDACLMSTIEVAYGIRHGFDVMVGSQEIEPGEGWPYHGIVAGLAANPGASPEEVGRMIVDAYVDGAVQHDPDVAVTQSTLRLDRLDAATDHVRAVADSLTGALDHPAFHGRTLLGVLRRVQKFRDSDCVDMVHFAGLLGDAKPVGSDDGALARAASELGALVAPGAEGSLVPYSRASGRSVKAANGLSIYVPLIGTPSPAYRDLEFAAASAWGRFLDAFSQVDR
jgi:hypothetical protein